MIRQLTNNNAKLSLTSAPTTGDRMREGKFWLKQDTNELYALLDVTGGVATWDKVLTANSTLPMDTQTDPLVDTALVTAVLDAYSGVIILTTGAGADQTFGVPTNTDPGSRFWVVNDDSSTHSFDVIGARTITIDPGEAEQYMYDGDAWIHITAADAEDITFNPAVSWATLTNIQSAWDEVHTATGLWMGASNSIYTTGNTNQLYLATDGKVGIGTVPSTIFDIVEDVAGASTIRILNQHHEDATTLEEIQLRGGYTSTLSGMMAKIVAGKEGVWTSTASTRDGYLSIQTSLDGNTVESARIHSDAMLDLYGGTITILAGADASAKTRTNVTQKQMRFGMPHYTNAEEPVGMIYGISDVTDNFVRIGGGTNTLNAATVTQIFSADDNTTTTGTEVARFEGGATKASMMGLGNSSLKGWHQDWSALQLGGTGSIFGQTSESAGGSIRIGENLYYDGDFKYAVTDMASRYEQYAGTHNFVVVTSGTLNTSTSGNETIALTIANDASSTFGGNVTLPSTATLNVETIRAIDASGMSFLDDGGSTKLSLADGLNGLITLSGGTGGVRVDNMLGVGVAPTTTKIVNIAYGSEANIAMLNALGNSGAWIQNSGGTGASQLDFVMGGLTTALSLNNDGSSTFGGDVGIGRTPTQNLDIYQSGSAVANLEVHTSVGAANIYLKGLRGAAGSSDIGRILSYWDGNNVAEIRFNTGTDTANKDDGTIQFYTSAASSSPALALTIGADQSSTFGGDVTANPVSNAASLWLKDTNTGIARNAADGSTDIYAGGVAKANFVGGANGLITLSGGTGGVSIGDKLILPTSSTPASAGATGVTGTITWDADYIYVCTATNTWLRAAIATW
jgi:hypothetical protein